MPTADRSRKLSTWQVAAVIVLSAVAFTAAYSWRTDAGDGSASDSDDPALRAGTIGQGAMPQQASLPALAAEPRIAVAFRLDPAVTRGLYLGDRWVSPAHFAFAQPGNRYVVQARLQQIAPDGERIDLNGQWSASDPAMVAIERGPHGVVTLVVREPGASQVTVSSGTESKVLKVHAVQREDAMQVAIEQ